MTSEPVRAEAASDGEWEWEPLQTDSEKVRKAFSIWKQLWTDADIIIN